MVYDNALKLAISEITNSTGMELLDVNRDELEFTITDDDFMEDYEKEFNIDVVNDSTNLKNPCPLKLPIEQYRMKMEEINDYVYKKVKSEGIGDVVDLMQYKVVFEYSLFLGKNEESFDSSAVSKRYEVIYLEKDQQPLPGIVEAVATMKYKEEAVFWLSYELMYGRLGVVNRIPPKSDIIACFKITKLFDNEGNEVKPKMSRFEKVLKMVDTGCKDSRHAFKVGDFEKAIEIYNKCINMMEKSHVAIDREEQLMKNRLIKIYLELAMCYNKMKNPEKTCLALRELEKLQSIAENAKAIFAKGKALMMLNDFKPARKLLQMALKLEPNCQSIEHTIKELDECEEVLEKFDAEKNQREPQFAVVEPNVTVNPMLERYLQTLEY